MRKYKRMFVIVVDSLGVGAMPDAEQFGDVGVSGIIAVICDKVRKRDLF